MIKNTVKKEVNTIKEPVKTKAPKAARPPKPKRPQPKIVKSFLSVIDGTFLTRDNFVNKLPFIFFLTLMALCYIASTYYSEKTIREIDKTKSALKELRSEYISSKSELVDSSKQTVVARKLLGYGIKESLEPPVKVSVSAEEKIK